MIQIFDESGHPLIGHGHDPEAGMLAKKALDKGQAIAERRGSRHLTARPVTDANGRQVVVVGESRSHPGIVDLLEPEVLLPRLALLALVAAALVWWLARYLSSPVAALRETTGALASGDLGARIENPVLGRSDEFGHLARDFNDMADRVELLIENQRRLLGDVSHELRSPLARLNVALELARQKTGSEVAGDLDRIELESSRLNDLIARLLELTRLEYGPGECVPIDLDALTEEVAADADFEASGVRVRFNGSQAGGVAVMAHADSLSSAIGNVIRNAVFFTGPGTDVDVVVSGQDDFARVSVADRGPGVPEGELGKIFDVFYRIEDARERSRGGAGLGLAIAAKAVKRHGGTISAINRDGGGLEVEILLPVIFTDQES